VLSTGVTTVVDWSHAFSPDFARGNVQALLDSGLRFASGVSNVDIDGNNTLQIKAIGIVISTFETLPGGNTAVPARSDLPPLDGPAAER
jgi:hypothetical protein